MPFRDGDYIQRDKDDIDESITTTARFELGDRDFINGSVLDSCFDAVSTTVAELLEPLIQQTHDAAYIQTATGDFLTLKAAEKGVQRRPAVAATGVVEFSRSTQPASDVTIPRGTVVSTEGQNPVRFETTEVATIPTNGTTATANIEALNGGEQGNVGPDVITALPSPPSGVEAVTNPNPTGDPNYTLTNGNAQRLGLNRETDGELRERALNTETFGGAATVDNIERAITSLDGDASVTIYNNRTTSTNGSGYGLDPLAMELVILQRGLGDSVIAEALHESVAPTSRLQSGVNGTSVTYTYEDETLKDNRTYEWSTPVEQQATIDFDIVVDGTYAGDDVVKDRIVSIIGGTDTDGGTIIGLGTGEDIIVDTLEGAVTSVRGVIGADVITIDTNGDGTDDTTNGPNGLRRLTVADNEIVTTDAANGDVTVTPTEV